MFPDTMSGRLVAASISGTLMTRGAAAAPLSEAAVSGEAASAARRVSPFFKGTMVGSWAAGVVDATARVTAHATPAALSILCV